MFGLPSTIRTCDLRLRRIRRCSNVYIFQWLTRLNRDCVINCAMTLWFDSINGAANGPKQLVVVGGSIVIILIGTYWLLERSGITI